MAPILKQFGEWVTKWRRNSFFRARLLLTTYYTASVVVLLIIFSLLLYNFLISGLQSEFSENATNGTVTPAQLTALDTATDSLQKRFIVMDAIVILVAAGVGYFVAGKTLQPVEAAYSRQKKFIADAAHELRTPLSVMRTGAQLALQHERGSREYKRVIQDSLEETIALSQLTDDLLFLARSDDLQQKTPFVLVDVAAGAAKQVELMQPLANQKSIALKAQIEGDASIWGNPAQLKRLVANLIKNAIDYNKPNGSVTVTVRSINNAVELKVSDTGIGIPSAEKERIFDRFYKVDEARTKNASGAGLGLSIVQEIVKLHQGSIQIESRAGHGTTVIVLFPQPTAKAVHKNN